MTTTPQEPAPGTPDAPILDDREEAETIKARAAADNSDEQD